MTTEETSAKSMITLRPELGGASDRAAILNQLHPDYASRADLWAILRAFTGVIVDAETKKQWLPQGEHEGDRTYAQRIALAAYVSSAKPAIRRLVGGITKKQPQRTYVGNDGKSGTDVRRSVLADRLKAFDANCDRQGATIDNFLREQLTEALKLSSAFVQVDQVTDPGTTLASTPNPFLVPWRREDVINWQLDEFGSPEWVVIRADLSRQEKPDALRQQFRRWIILTRTTGEILEAPMGQTGSGGSAPVSSVRKWTHNLGIVPLVHVPPFRVSAMVADSYCEELAISDRTGFVLESDQLIASSVHASPRMVIETSSPLSEVMADTGRAIKLNPDKGEKVSMLAFDAAGVDSRERLIARRRADADRATGLDATTTTGTGSGSTGGARSGASIAWGFSTSEGPMLSAIAEAMQRADYEIHEIVARYILGAPANAGEAAFQGEIAWPREWDMLTPDRAVDLVATAEPAIKSPTWRKAAARYLAAQIPGNIPADVLTAINDEIESADYSAPEVIPPAPQPPIADPAAQQA